MAKLSNERCKKCGSFSTIRVGNALECSACSSGIGDHCLVTERGIHDPRPTPEELEKIYSERKHRKAG